MHIEHVKEIVAKKEGEPRRQKCQGEMVLRTVKRGEKMPARSFWGVKRFQSVGGLSVLHDCFNEAVK